MTIEQEISKRRAVAFSEYQELVLYHPKFGFYETGGMAGRDFLTSVELGTVFAEVLSRAIDSWWIDLGSPSEFYFIEVGASRGKLAKDVTSQPMKCSSALRYIGVERSARLRSEWMADVPVVSELPTDLSAAIGVVFSNELFDNIPVDVYDDRDQLLVKVVKGKPSWHRRIVGQMFPEQQVASRWLDAALRTFATGRLVAIDYARNTADMRAADPDSWLRSYRGQQRVGIFDFPGESDLTCDVAVDQLRWVRTPRATMTQAQFLHLHGLDDIYQEATSAWEANAAAGNLDAMRARARLTEMAALIDPSGLGGFTVLEWNCS